jgi:hypothetical protein
MESRGLELHNTNAAAPDTTEASVTLTCIDIPRRVSDTSGRGVNQEATVRPHLWAVLAGGVHRYAALVPVGRVDVIGGHEYIDSAPEQPKGVDPGPRGRNHFVIMETRTVPQGDLDSLPLEGAQLCRNEFRHMLFHWSPPWRLPV